MTQNDKRLTDTRVAAIKAPAEGRDEYPDWKVTGLRLRVGISGRKVWIVRARAGASVINKKLGVYPHMGLADAREAAGLILEQLDQNGGSFLKRTFGHTAEAWVDEHAKRHNTAWENQHRLLQRHVYPEWKDKKLADINRDDVEELIAGIEGDVLPNRVHTTVKTIFRWAVSEKRWLNNSPAEGVKKSKVEVARDRWLTMDEVRAVWDRASLLGYPFGPWVRMLLLTGQRRTEVASMRWQDIDLEEKTWLIRAEDAKNRRAHIVPLSAPAIEILEMVPQMGPYVFSTDGKSHVQGYAKAKALLDTYITAKGGGVDPWVFHDLRRSAATHMVRLGVLMEVVGRVLNHSPTGITAKVYGLHQYLPEKRGALDRWAAEVMRAVTGVGDDNVVALHG
jgi:integrase